MGYQSLKFVSVRERHALLAEDSVTNIIVRPLSVAQNVSLPDVIISRSVQHGAGLRKIGITVAFCGPGLWCHITSKFGLPLDPRNDTCAHFGHKEGVRKFRTCNW